MLSEYYKIDNIAPSFVFVTNGTDSSPAGTYSLNLSCTFTDTFGAFIESYGALTRGIFETRTDTGVAWLLTQNLQLDLFGGYGSNHGLTDYFISTGFSWRTSR